MKEEHQRLILSVSIFIRKCREQGGMEQAELNKLLEMCELQEKLTSLFLALLGG